MTATGRQFVLEAAHQCGITIRTGPVDIGYGTLLVEEHLAPHGWNPKFLTLTPLDTAIRMWNAGPRPDPVEEADLFVALRRAIYTDTRFDGVDCGRAQTLVAHLEAHRPWQMWTGDEDCLLAECGHDTKDGRCPTIQPADPICRACTPTYDHNNEYGIELLEPCRIAWPCTIVTQIAAQYAVPTGGAA